MGHEDLVTEAVRAQVAAESERWLRAGLSTERCDRPAAEAAVAEVYRAHGMPAPRTVVWMDSPLGGALAFWLLRHGCEDRLDGTLVGGAVAGPPIRVPQAFARQAEERILEQIPAREDTPGRPEAGRERRRLTGTFSDTSGAQAQLVEVLGHPLFDQLDFYWLQDVRGAYELEQEMSRIFAWPTHACLSHIGGLTYKDLLGRVRGPVPERIAQPERDGDVITPPPPPSREQIYFHEQFGGRLDYWAAPFELIRWRCTLAAAGLPASPTLDAVQEALYRSGGWWPLEDAVVLVERPVVLRYEEAVTDAPASRNVLVRYADGYHVASP
ncbi:hypothetical protein [Streptomyces fulvoviolaceus]|uniref:hypothetical protein n=1 Tax=Streptomyces fulvoviolaceus TaxID=285535 RepID=UPI0004CAF8C3|nr:hypothetical protein [Streptomyces fulvoviolaceus]